MTGLVIVNAGEEWMLDQITASGITLRLFTNDVTSGLTSTEVDELVAGDFTEATFAGYSAAALTGGAWTTTPGDPSTATYAAQTFTRSSTGTGQQVRGYYLTRTTGGALVGFEEFATPITVTASGDAIVVTPVMTLDDSSEGTMPTGTIVATGRSTAPTGWLLCDGAAVSRTTYAALFAAIGTTYGAGNGSTTFNVPDLEQRFPLGKAASGTGATLGATGGAIDHVHSVDLTDGATAYGQITERATGGASPHMRRISTASWTSNVSLAGGGTAQADATLHGDGAGLGGDTATENPPFQVVNFMVKT